MNQKNKQRLHAHLTGRVQGVGFRYHTMKAAQDLGLTGWVRNLRDGRVEVVAEGDLDRLNKLLQDLRKGPPSASVENIDYDFSDSKDDFNQFQVRYTA
jgi:acylphosphatase